MELFDNLLLGLSVAISPVNILYLLAGALIGMVIGIIPGFGPAAGLSILLPLTFGMDPTGAIMMLAAIYYGAMYGGTITSILLNTPGESAVVASTFDGYPLAQQGRAGPALVMQAVASLRSENERLASFNQRLQGQVDDFAKRGIGDIKVVEVKLPVELDRALKEFAAQYPDEVEYDPQRGAVRWKSDLTFAKGSDEVRPNAMGSLQAFADIVGSAAASAFEVIVVGHTDNLRIGPITAKLHPTNWHLSVHRSIAVMNVLARSGIGQDRLGVMGYGEHRPTVPNPTAGGSETNRRVEIFLVANRDDVPDDVTALGPEAG